MVVEISCDNCDKTIETYKSRVKNKNYCSKKCMGEDKKQNIEVTCDFCGKKLQRVKSDVNEKNFCNKNCRGKYLEKKVKMNCKNCGKTVKRRPSTAGNKAFCSKKCQLKCMTKKNTEAEYPKEFNKKLKNKVREKDLYTCQICGISNEKCRKKYGAQLDIHHMDEDKNNNSLNNLTALCRSCHGCMKNKKQAEKLLNSKNTMSYKKGYRRENQCKNLLKECGFEAERSQNPAYSSGDYFGLFDIIAIRNDRKPRLIQVKSNQTGGALKEILESQFIPDKHFEVEVWVAHDGEGWRVKRMNGGEWDTIIDERDSDMNYGECLKNNYE